MQRIFTRFLHLPVVVSKAQYGSEKILTHGSVQLQVHAHLLMLSACRYLPRGTIRISEVKQKYEEDSLATKGQITNHNIGGYDYFAKYAQAVQNQTSHPKDDKVYGELAKINVSKLRPVLPTSSQSLITYVNDSVTLANLVKLGVDLSKVETNIEASNYIVKTDFEKDIQPYLFYLHRLGVQDSDIGKFITKNPMIFLEYFDDMDARINYFKSKKFEQNAISTIITKMPKLLSTPVTKIDAQLGYLQKEFSLRGDEVRTVITRYPKLALWNRSKIMDIRFTLDKFLGFSKKDMKDMLLAHPKIFVSDKHALRKRFDYIHNIMGIPHSLIVAWPSALRSKTDNLKNRHNFLKYLGRAQYDPSKENYVSLKGFVCGRDVEFCENVAKTGVQHYNDFLKTQ